MKARSWNYICKRKWEKGCFGKHLRHGCTFQEQLMQRRFLQKLDITTIVVTWMCNGGMRYVLIVWVGRAHVKELGENFESSSLLTESYTRTSALSSDNSSSTSSVWPLSAARCSNVWPNCQRDEVNWRDNTQNIDMKLWKALDIKKTLCGTKACYASAHAEIS